MFDVFIMDMGGHDENLVQLTCRLPHAQTMRYIGTHLEMVKRAAKKSKTEFFWLIASCCDYTNFDFNYIPVPWEEKQIHCWASGNQKFGDTLLINKSAWQEQANVEKLEWYNAVNYHANGVQRFGWPTVNATDDLAVSVMQHTFNSLYNIFYTTGSSGIPRYDMNLWENREVIAFNRTGHVSICPRDVKQAIKTQIYDWPYIKYQNDLNIEQMPQDIVFISYDEENAEHHWELLKHKQPRAQRIHGVVGLFNALQEAARLASTDWFYAVFAKTQVHEDFNFSYRPDYLRHPANYVFKAYNPILKHSYGHGAIVLHNRRWLLENTVDDGADITMSMPVVSVPILSCVNNYNETPWSAYRTAFREVYKLKSMDSIEDQYHLHLWLTCNEGLNGEWSQRGAVDATNTDNANINDWDYLKERFDEH